MKKSSSVLCPLVVALAAALGACAPGAGSAESPGVSSVAPAGAQSPAGPHNQADIGFVVQMVPHHEQGVEMADLALELSDNTEVLELAQRIKEAQAPELLTMKGWLAGWGPAATVPPPSPSDPASPDAAATSAAPGAPADPGTPATPADPAAGHGMMTTEEMDTLANSTGEQFDDRWVDMMIRHHQGAVAMADTVLDRGRNPEVEELAETIRKTQNAEIRELRLLQ